MRPGIKLEQEVVGSGREASRGDSVTIRYDLYLNRGDKVDSRQHTFTIGDREVMGESVQTFRKLRGDSQSGVGLVFPEITEPH